VDKKPIGPERELELIFWYSKYGRVLNEALDVWDNIEEAIEFLTTPHPLTCYQKPIDYLDTDEGEASVLRILTNIRYGLPV
jgi:uncharacterized protein (DUF2384 family)